MQVEMVPRKIKNDGNERGAIVYGVHKVHFAQVLAGFGVKYHFQTP